VARDGHGYGFGYEHADPHPYPDKPELGRVWVYLYCTRRPAGPTGLKNESSSLDFRSFPMSQSTLYSLNCLCGGRGRFAFDSTAVAVSGIEVEAHAPSDKSVCRSPKSRLFPLSQRPSAARKGSPYIYVVYYVPLPSRVPPLLSPFFALGQIKLSTKLGIAGSAIG
jgi:hypothetical protein